MKKILIFALVALFFAGCNSVPKLREGLVFPEMISPIYYLDTFQIPSPVVAIINSIPYILPETALEHFETADDLLQRKDVINYLSYELNNFKRSGYVEIYQERRNSMTFRFMHYKNEFNYLDIIHFVDSVRGIPIFKFDLTPKTFLLTLIAREETIIAPGGDTIEDILYSKDYILAIAPIFNKRDNKELERRFVEKYLKE